MKKIPLSIVFAVLLIILAWVWPQQTHQINQSVNSGKQQNTSVTVR